MAKPIVGPVMRLVAAAALSLVVASACTESCSKRANAPTCGQVNWTDTAYSAVVIGLIVALLAVGLWLRRRR